MKTFGRALVGMMIIMMVSIATAQGQTSSTKTTTVTTTTTTTTTVSGGDTTIVIKTETTVPGDPWAFVDQVFRQVLSADSIKGWNFDAKCDTLVRKTESVWKQMNMDSLMVELKAKKTENIWKQMNMDSLMVEFKKSLTMIGDTIAQRGGEAANSAKAKVAESTKISKAQADSMRAVMRKTTEWIDTWLNALTDEEK